MKNKGNKLIVCTITYGSKSTGAHQDNTTPPKILEKLSPQKIYIYISLQNSPAPLISGGRVTPWWSSMDKNRFEGISSTLIVAISFTFPVSY